ncbi:zinc-binding dehydrogenase [Roseovarius sp. D0-M9]|uniref:zinc-binding dehydrogenase n=1 Tax=Roseovarius sp. D0-M9 TaxID=3127117 RepID=UPI003010182F
MAFPPREVEAVHNLIGLIEHRRPACMPRDVPQSVSSETGLVLAEHDEPEAGSDEAIVAVRAFSLNNGEVRGALHEGTDCDRPGWARVPDDVSFEAASTLPVAGLTAAVALQKKAIGPGSRVLVTSATGGVGIYAIQLAAAAGVHVTAFARDASNAEFLRSLGTDEIAVGIEAGEEGCPSDLLLEGVGGTFLGEALMWLAPRSACVLFGDASQDTLTPFDARPFRESGASKDGQVS